MLNIPADSVILTKDEYMVLVKSAKALRELSFTREEADAIIFAIRKLNIADIYGETGEEKIRHMQTMVNVAKKVEKYGNI